MPTLWRISMVVTEEKLNMVVDLFKGECSAFSITKVDEHKNSTAPAVLKTADAVPSINRNNHKPANVSGPMYDIIRSKMREQPVGTVFSYETIGQWLVDAGYKPSSYSSCMTNLIRVDFARRMPERGTFVRV